MSVKSDTVVHIVIPDTQVAPDVPTEHLSWISRYVWDEYRECSDLTVVHLGDHWDMPSLSSYDRGKRQMEGRRYVEDITAGARGVDQLSKHLPEHARKVFLLGNHEHRIERAAEDNAQLDGLVTLSHVLDPLEDWGWEVYPYLAPVTIHGIVYSHFFYNPMTGRPYSGANLETRLKTIGHSFTMGHQQGLKWGRIDTVKGPHLGLVAGSCYLHDPEYLGPQAVSYWRGIIVKHDVDDGDYSPMFVSLSYLERRYGW